MKKPRADRTSSKRKRLADVPMPSGDQPFLTRLEACRLARIGTSTFDKKRAAGLIKVRWNSTRMIVERAEIVRFIESLPPDAPPKK